MSAKYFGLKTSMQKRKWDPPERRQLELTWSKILVEIQRLCLFQNKIFYKKLCTIDWKDDNLSEVNECLFYLQPTQELQEETICWSSEGEIRLSPDLLQLQLSDLDRSRVKLKDGKFLLNLQNYLWLPQKLKLKKMRTTLHFKSLSLKLQSQVAVALWKNSDETV